MTAPGAANEVRLEIFANQIDGWVLFDDVTLRELVEGDEEERSIYTLAGRPIAVRNVTFNPSGTPTADDLRYVLSDHLGSHSAFTDETGSLIDTNGSGTATYQDIVLYEPFGAYRNNARPE